MGKAPGLDAHAEAAPEGEEEALSDFGASGSREAGDEGEEDEGGETEAGHLDPGGEEDAGGLGEAGLLFELEDLDDGEAEAPEGTGEDEEEDGHACGGYLLLVTGYWVEGGGWTIKFEQGMFDFRGGGGTRVACYFSSGELNATMSGDESQGLEILVGCPVRGGFGAVAWDGWWLA